MTIKNKIAEILFLVGKYTKTDMNYVAKGGFWWIIGKAIISLFSFITMIVFANWLSKEDYGIYQFIIAGLTLLSIFTLPGIHISLIKSIAQKKEGTLGLAVREKARWGLIGSTLSLCLAGWYFIQENNLLAAGFLLVSFFVPLRENFHIFTSFWNGRKRLDVQAKYEVISAGLSTLLLILAIYLTNNVLIIIAVFLSSHTFFDWLFYRKTQQQITNNEEDAEAILFGKHLTLMGALNSAATHLDKIIIWKFLGVIPVATYTFALLPIQKIINILPITPLALPRLSENKIEEQRKRGIISKFLRLFVVTVPAAAILALAAPFLYGFIFPQYLESIVYFQAFSLLVALSPFFLLSATLIAEMKKKALYIINIGAPLLKIILFLALIPYFGIWGIVAAILIDEILRGMLALYFFLKI